MDKTEVSVPGRYGAPDVRLILYRPAGITAILPGLYHIHGGGYVGGDPSSMESIHRTLADELGCALVTVDYRLAPETPYPGPLEDCYAGLAWLFAHAESLRIDGLRIGVIGESAGGGLAAGLALLARDRGEFALAFQHLIYPMIDDRTCSKEPHPFSGDFAWTPASNLFAWRSYLAAEPESSGIPQYAAAARAPDLSALPPTYIACGALDLFVDENICFATRLIRAGVPTELHIYPKAVHGFDLADVAGIAKRARKESTEALKSRLHPMNEPGKLSVVTGLEPMDSR